MVGPYEIVAEIGAGGYATVYEAADASERVALKVVHVEYHRDKRAGERALIEIDSLRRIDHPNVVRYVGSGLAGNEIWLAMELLEGKSLFQLLSARGQLPMEEALDIARQICAGLGVAHSLSINHRDIKPSNIFVTKEGIAKIIDFGIARQAAVSLGTTNVIGTPLYLSPDYLRKGPGSADPRHDLYALCLVTWQCIVGRHPFIRETDHTPSLGALVDRVMRETVTPLSELIPGCPERIDRCIARGLEKHIGAGWQSAAELEAELAAGVQLLRRMGERRDPQLEAKMRAVMGSTPTPTEAASPAPTAPSAAPTVRAAPVVQSAAPASPAPVDVTPHGTVVMGQPVPAQVLAHACVQQKAAAPGQAGPAPDAGLAPAAAPLAEALETGAATRQYLDEIEARGGAAESQRVVQDRARHPVSRSARPLEPIAQQARSAPVGRHPAAASGSGARSPRARGSIPQGAVPLGALVLLPACAGALYQLDLSSQWGIISFRLAVGVLLVAMLSFALLVWKRRVASGSKMTVSCLLLLVAEAVVAWSWTL
ncbi:MAG: hypothetical protein DRI90_17050 [Deltaproteobacteria bacterium]|nr:MAG: hypothetical protein DRI90_17050 [Deltaproteobacteria bacterium]